MMLETFIVLDTKHMLWHAQVRRTLKAHDYVMGEVCELKEQHWQKTKTNLHRNFGGVPHLHVPTQSCDGKPPLFEGTYSPSKKKVSITECQQFDSLTPDTTLRRFDQCPLY